MKILYPYNEVLPNYMAHDRFVFASCAHLAAKGAEVTLLCGQGTKNIKELHQHYHTTALPNFKVKLLPIIRKKFFNLFNYNRLFFFFCQRVIQQEKADLIIISVRKQGTYHLNRKIFGSKYLYEVHELAYYPGDLKTEGFYAEKKMLAKADHITVTTEALRTILQREPYQLSVPISVIPLATTIERLPPPSPSEMLRLFYVGALYQGQGIDLLLEALVGTEGVSLSVVGGKSEEINDYCKKRDSLGLTKRVHFLGFHSPSELTKIVSSADVFVAPFSSIGRMPYVAHTKLNEYAAWGRPIIAPDLAIVKEHLEGAILFTPDDRLSLQKAIVKLQDKALLKEVQKKAMEIIPFTWEERVDGYLALTKTLF